MRETENEKKEKFWRREMELISKYPGSASEYCRRHGLSRSVYEYWQRKFSIKGAIVPSRPAFAEVVVEPRRARVWPDPQWLAELIIRLQEGAR